jgi:hypothetical protein
MESFKIATGIRFNDLRQFSENVNTAELLPLIIIFVD